MNMKEYAARADRIKQMLDIAILWYDVDIAKKRIERLHEIAEQLDDLADHVYAANYSDSMLSQRQIDIKAIRSFRWVKELGGGIYPEAIGGREADEI